MSITSFGFLCCFAAGLLIYYVIPKRMQWLFLLAASVAYYLMAGPLWLIGYPIAMVGITYIGALYVDKVKEPKKKKRGLSLVVVLNLMVLICLKYGNFGIYTYNAVCMRLIPGSTLLKELHFAVPLGLSFYTLMLMGYLLDVYYEIAKPQKNFFKLLLFGIYFPTMISGPIVKYRNMEGELFSEHRLDYKNLTHGLQRMLWGFFKKLVIAERMAVIVNTVYRDFNAWPGVYIFLATICFAIQLYSDFSGGMDIVIGLSQVLGIRLAENFQTPYFSKSIQEFWRRWHITLGVWLKDYLFYPLLRCGLFTNLQKRLKDKWGKKVAKKFVTYLAMLVLWFAIGLWHGGAWKYIIGSGLLHWAYIVLGEIGEPVWQRLYMLCKVKKENPIWIFLQRLRTFLLVCGGFVFFRASSATDALCAYRYMFSTFNLPVLWHGGLTELGLDWPDLTVAAVALLLLLLVSCLQQKASVREMIDKKPIAVRWCLWYALLFFVIIFGYYGPGYSASEFIYQGF